MTQALRQRGGKVLLIDGDLDAPGISWLLKTRFPAPAISFTDFLILAHGEASADYGCTINLLVQELKKLQEDNVWFLPAFRTNDGMEDIAIRPEHLIEGQTNPFILSDLLVKIGQGLGADYVVVDLRAGISTYCDQLIFAENGRTWEFLSTVPLRNLVTDNSNDIPIALVIGAKGAGKTYSYLQLARLTTWGAFSRSFDITTVERLDAHVRTSAYLN